MTDIDRYAKDNAEARAQLIRYCIGSLITWQREVITAYRERDWITLGYDSWADYVDAEFGETADLLGSEQRKLVIAAMAEADMSTRAIAAAVGVNQSTVSRALTSGQVMHDASPVDEQKQDEHIVGLAIKQLNQWMTTNTVDEDDEAGDEPKPTVVGTDGKNYPAAQPARTANRFPLPKLFRTRTTQVFKVTNGLERLMQDDRFRSNLVSIADQCVPELRRARDVLDDLLERLAQEVA